MKTRPIVRQIAISYGLLLLCFVYESPQPLYLLLTGIIQCSAQYTIYHFLNKSRGEYIGVFRAFVFMTVCPL